MFECSVLSGAGPSGMQSCWVQQEGQEAEELKLRSGCALEELLSSLGSLQRVKFQRQDGSYVSYPSGIPLDDLIADCSQDGRAAATALQIRLVQTQGPVFLYFRLARAVLGQRLSTVSKGEGSVV